MITDNESRGICAKTTYKNRLSARTDRCLTTMKLSCPQKRAVLRPLSQNCSMRAVFRILRLALGGEGRLGEVAGEQQSRQQEGGAQSGVEEGDEPVRGHAAGPQPDAAGHHHCHDGQQPTAKRPWACNCPVVVTDSSSDL